MKKKLIRITTVPISLDKLIEGQLAFINKFYEVIGVSSGGEVLKKVEIKEGIRVQPITMTRKITPLRDLISVWELYKFFKKEQPFVVHTHTPKAGIVGMLAAKLANVQNRLHTVAGLPLLETQGVKRMILNFVEKLTYRCATKVYPNSFGLKNIIVENNLGSKEKLKVLANGSSNGIDTSYFNPSLFSNEENQKLKDELGISKNDFVFVFVGRLVGDKGINELVVAFEKLQLEKNSKLQIPKFKILLVGPLEQELDPLQKGTLNSINQNPNIISVGYQNDVRPYFAISNVLVFPSYREGFPNVVMQAGAMGLPSIVSDINGCNEIISEGENGWIVPVKDKESLLKTMGYCIFQEEAFNRVKEKCRAMIQNRFEQKRVWEAILKEYQMLEGKG